MARIRPARGGQDRSGDGGATPPAPGGARPPAPKRRTPAKKASAKQTPQPRPAQQGQRRKQEKAGSVTKAVVQQRRGSRFLQEVIAELKKVSWPTRTQLLQSTAVVLAVVAIVAVYLAALDSVFERVVDALF
ncbi:MAG TPA: preprotein translocase subunit SecE [Miltoncostaeaceae bacterium]|nr:preprotein translocase subunit SecE [Miltoncostaeaceae bacterium]